MINSCKLIRKTIAYLSLMLVISILLTGCGNRKNNDNMQNSGNTQNSESDGNVESMSNGNAEFTKISPEQAYERMHSGDSIIILDVRRADEYEAGHIEGAVLLPNEDISDIKPDILPDLDAEILVYCRSGRRSKQAAQKLADLGYTNVYEFGGIIDWPYETVVDDN